MSFDIAKLATDQGRENEGTWIDVGDDCRLCIARVGNRRYTDEVSKIARKNNVATLDNDTARKKMIDVYARTILLGWEGLQENGEDVPYTQENARRMLTEYPDFFRMIEAEASNAEHFRRSNVEETAGN